MSQFVMRVISAISAVFVLPQTVFNKGLKELNQVEKTLVGLVVDHANDEDRICLEDQLNEINLVGFNAFGSGYEVGFQKISGLLFINISRRKSLNYSGETTFALWSGVDGNEKVLAKVFLIDGNLSSIRFSKKRIDVAAGAWVWTGVKP